MTEGRKSVFATTNKYCDYKVIEDRDTQEKRKPDNIPSERKTPSVKELLDREFSPQKDKYYTTVYR